MKAADEIQSFVHCLFAAEDVVEWRAIGSGPVQRGWALARDLPALSDSFSDLNGDGFNIYIGANPRSGQGKTGDVEVPLCRAIFVDFDRLDGQDYDAVAMDRITAAGLPAPTLRIYSGHGIHAYWRLTESVSPDIWRAAQERFIEALGSDPVIRNPERIMRAPGFLNVKDAPVRCFTIEADRTRLFDLEDLLSHCPPLQIVTDDLPAAIQSHAVPDASPLARRARMMKYASRWESVPEGQRNEAAFYHAAQLVNDLQVDPEDAVEILRLWNSTNVPPLPDREIVTVIKSGQHNAKLPPGCKVDQPRRQSARQRVTTGKPPSPAPSRARDTAIRPVYVRMSQIEGRPVQWLWQNRLPAGMLSLMVGVEGSGKTFAALDIAARITRGSAWPDCAGPAFAPNVGSIVFLTSEDHLAFTVRPRLDAMGADPSRVAVLQGVTILGGDAFFDVTQHGHALERMIQEIGDVALVIADPISAYLGDTDQCSNGEVRTALLRFTSIAETYGCAILGISHLSKDVTKAAIHRTLGSVAFSASARAVWLVTKDRENADRRLLVPVKMNIGQPARSLAFRVKDMAVEWEERQFDYNADDLLADRKDETPMGEAAQFIRDLLADGPVKSTEIKSLAKREGICEKTLRRAKADLGIVAVKDGMGAGSTWFWRLPYDG